MKKILIDAKWVYKGPPSGKVVVQSQLEEYKNYVDDYEITLLLDLNDPNIDLYKSWGFKTLKIPNISLLSNFFIFPILFFYKRFDSGIFQNSAPLFFLGDTYLFVHDIIFKSHPQFFTRFERIIFSLILVSFKLTDYVITISENEKNRICNYGYAEKENVFVINNGVDHLSTVENKSKEEALDFDGDFILYVGRINDRKNVKTIIQAMDFVSSDVKLVIAGAKDWKNSIGTSDSGRVIFKGFVSSHFLRKLYSEAKAFVFVSYEEGFGLPPLEAMMHEVPVIVSDRSCFPEICGEAPIYVDPDNPVDLANKIDYVCNDEELRKSMILKGKRIAKRYTWKGNVKQMISIIGS